MKKQIISDLFFTFAKIGLFTFGGGYAMIALIEDQCVEKKGWLTNDELAAVTAIAESTPGPIAINCATYTGYMQSGFFGALSATLGMIFPSFVIIFLISMLFDDFLEIAVIARAFKGIKISVGILIFQAAVRMLKKMKKQPQQIFIVSAAFACMLAVNIFGINFSSVYIILISGTVSIIMFRLKNHKALKEMKK